MHAFEYVAPASVDDALGVLAEHGDEAKVLAGGQSLIPALNYRLAKPRVVVHFNHLPLGDVGVENDRLRLDVRAVPPEHKIFAGRYQDVATCVLDRFDAADWLGGPTRYVGRESDQMAQVVGFGRAWSLSGPFEWPVVEVTIAQTAPGEVTCEVRALHAVSRALAWPVIERCVRPKSN